MRAIWHPWTEWECIGMYVPTQQHNRDEALMAYRDFLRDIPRFQAAMARVLREWPKSCEHFLTKAQTNRIAWLGQASMSIDTGVPAKYKSGYGLMSKDEQKAADDAAAEVLAAWIIAHP